MCRQVRGEGGGLLLPQAGAAAEAPRSKQYYIGTPKLAGAEDPSADTSDQKLTEDPWMEWHYVSWVWCGSWRAYVWCVVLYVCVYCKEYVV